MAGQWKSLDDGLGLRWQLRERQEQMNFRVQAANCFCKPAPRRKEADVEGGAHCVCQAPGPPRRRVPTLGEKVDEGGSFIYRLDERRDRQTQFECSLKPSSPEYQLMLVVLAVGTAADGAQLDWRDVAADALDAQLQVLEMLCIDS